MEDFMKVPCKHCPFRKDVTPYLHPERAADLAYAAANPYNSFACHKTTECDEESEEGDMLVTQDSKECAGFLTLRAVDGCEEDLPEGFKPSFELCYEDAWEMSDAYQEEWDKKVTLPSPMQHL